jgi:hypothetical protein
MYTTLDEGFSVAHDEKQLQYTVKSGATEFKNWKINSNFDYADASFDAANGKYTVPSDGRYMISSEITFASVTTAPPGVTMALFINDVAHASTFICHGSISEPRTISLRCNAKCARGDVLQLKFVSKAAYDTQINLVGDAVASRFSAQRQH